MRTRGIVVAVSLVVGLLVAVPTTAPTQAAVPRAASGRLTPDERQVDRAPVPRLAWQKCLADSELSDRVECAVIRVPLDYDRPRGATTPLSVIRLRAAQPGRRIGSLFVNPGGPGGSSSQFVLGAAEALGPRAQQRFDIVGVDPRGVAGSGRTSCRGPVPTPEADFPVGRAQVRAQLRFDAAVRRACARKGTALVRHASTADVARDMDLVRRALGDRQLTYYGISYGSYLGSTYAAMFPSRVRALVIDGVLDPIAWSTGATTRRVSLPQTTRLRSGFGSYEALTAAFTECDRVGRGRCALAPDALGTWRRILAAARAGRLVVGGETLGYQTIVGLALGALYDRRSIPQLVELLASLEAALDAVPLRQARGRDARPVRVAATPAYQHLVRARDALRERGLFAAPLSTGVVGRASSTTDVQFPAVLCSDGRNPRPGYRWERAATQADRRTPWFGRLWTWSSSVCAERGLGSSADAFRGPWSTRTSYPLLIVGNTHDPATPISGARRANTAFRDSVMLTYDAWGHGALGGGGCVTSIMTRYLVDRSLPRAGTVCRQPKPLFR